MGDFLMKSLATTLGINRTSDASVCLIERGRIACAIQKERLSRVKHDWGKLGDFRQHYSSLEQLKETEIDFVVECYSSDSEAQNIELYRQELVETLPLSPKCVFAEISHHLAHVYSTSAIFLEDAAVMVIDFMGSPASRIVEPWPDMAACPANHVETASFYHILNGEVRCIAKQLWNRDRTKPVGLGCFYSLLTQLLFPGEGNEGKVMGLSPFGNASDLHLPMLDIHGFGVHVPHEWLALFADKDRFSYFQTGRGSFQQCANLAAAGQLAFEVALQGLSESLIKNTNTSVLCFAGGTALNCVANSKLLKRVPNLSIPPSPGDGGTAVGCGVYGFRTLAGSAAHVNWSSDFLGPEPDTQNLAETVVKAGFCIQMPKSLPNQVAHLIADGSVVGLFQGRSELGPRALGHRSILADPRKALIRDFVNRSIKGRELFRPLAPVVKVEEYEAYFEIDRPSNYMQYAATVKKDRRDHIPAVVHVDGTARLQTLNRNEDEFLWLVLDAFQSITGLPVLLNTSFNGPGEPIVERFTEALQMFSLVPLGALVCPPYLITRKEA